MHLRQVSTRNFRTLQNFSANFSSAYCTLSGQNNAGKTGIVSIIRHFLDEEDRRYRFTENSISFQKDLTQWSDDDFMEVSITVHLDRHDDAEVFFVVDKFSPISLTGDFATVKLSETFNKDGSVTKVCSVNESDLDAQNSSEVFKKLKAAANLVVHNSTNPDRPFYYFSGEMTEVLVSHFSVEDRKKISDAERNLSNKVKKAAREHKEELSRLLGKLGENYSVELTTLETSRSSRFPVSVTLNDKSVEVNLSAWGSGTQNRTRVLMSVLEADRIRKSNSAENRSTPVVIVEEPESFLHPSAQAEFGKVLNRLATDFDIQIIATTHSPYMLNQTHPEANILLHRKTHRAKLKETYRIETEGDDWMVPFAENLGVATDEFIPWKKIISSTSNRAVLVEGELDVSYFEIIKNRFPQIYPLADDIEIVAYNGKDALKNTQLLKFMISRLDRVFITFDLDAMNTVSCKLESIGLEMEKDFCAIGVSGPGKECIEGLLPKSIHRSVYSEQIDAVTALGGADSSARRSAKSKLKKACIEKFKSEDVDESDLSELKKLLLKISRAFD
ncbi:ATP-dependent nuclease [Roseovarius nanhaiticus]|uniref:ATP-dependent nuclease n=1 Tax=Roseovarius nanhaiticus TaxID=573024 RepID=UPI0024933AE7|nr:AAA family ATPase [Roseovarius nanhaiticus]